MPKKVDLTGTRFGHLTVISEAGRNDHGHVLWFCVCECGNKVVRPNTQIRGAMRENANSHCGCKKSEIVNAVAHKISASVSLVKTKHGQATMAGKNSGEYAIWKTMRQRCMNKNSADYPKYGGRGISVCERWSEFENFIRDMGSKPKGRYSLDRINNNGNYEPSNCRWATDTEQANNRRPRRWAKKPTTFEVTI